MCRGASTGWLTPEVYRVHGADAGLKALGSVTGITHRTTETGVRSGDSTPREHSALENLKFPVCDEHGKKRPPAVAFEKGGALQFRSYGYYREFCRRNGIERRG
ncbi:MAG: hypothetical protein HY744_30115 [Deltaproteobacteria bacterium]|nr:hypothetical protein [Deltaproteobacteria bacterium]